MKKVILLFGGESNEHEVSIRSAKFILDNIDRRKYEVIPIGITKDGSWYFFKGENLDNWLEDMEPVTNIIDALKSVDIVFPMIHGAYGEDGRIQSLCELFHIAYVGCDSKSSMICMDKEYTKIIAEKNYIPMLPYKVVNSADLNSVTSFPVIVKPANGGSSIGIGIAHNNKELKEKYKEAKIHDNKVIIEEYKKVRELEVAVLSDKKKYYISGIGEILTEGDVYDYFNKYVNSKNTVLKANISKNIEKKIYEMVEKLLIIFNINGMARIDFFYVEEEEVIYFNEINTIPGFTSISMYPSLMANARIKPKRLITKLIEN